MLSAIQVWFYYHGFDIFPFLLYSAFVVSIIFSFLMGWYWGRKKVFWYLTILVFLFPFVLDKDFRKQIDVIYSQRINIVMKSERAKGCQLSIPVNRVLDGLSFSKSTYSISMPNNLFLTNITLGVDTNYLGVATISADSIEKITSWSGGRLMHGMRLYTGDDVTQRRQGGNVVDLELSFRFFDKIFIPSENDKYKLMFLCNDAHVCSRIPFGDDNFARYSYRISEEEIKNWVEIEGFVRGELYKFSTNCS